ncbi:hypothetical protein [Halorubrum sodomense]|uniref:Uncharacterized protein n=1 Tax=Halorubrum sodomense TaxID=35743 RepID=A0A1I6FMQ3_HALSD|nr:hypothetical protein [Halorubrum sodomense]SFR31158.1 hypothetical protein SAMN04487937_0999 [Halorubrum sodomense]
MSLPKKIGLAIGLFAVVGIGLGLSGYISINAVEQFFMNAETGEVGPLAQTFVALVALQTTFVVFLLGSIVSTVTGSRIAAEASSTKEAMIANGAASFVGFYLMVGLALVIMFAAVGSGDASGGGGGGGGNVDLGRFVSPILQVGIPTGLVGVAAGGILQKLD